MDFDELLRQHVTQDEPPLGLTSAGMVRAAKHRQRLSAVVGAAAVGTAVTLIGTLTLAAPGAPPNGFADPESSACTSTLRPGVPMPQSSEFPQPLDLPRPWPSTYPMPTPSPSEGINFRLEPSSGASDPATADPYLPSATPRPSDIAFPTDDPSSYPAFDPSAIPDESLRPIPSPSNPPELKRLTCLLITSVDRFAPGATVSTYEDPGYGPLAANEWYAIRGGHSTSAVLHDEQGYGLITVSVGLRATGVPPDATKCRATAACQARQGPHGEQIEVYTSTDGGRVGYWVYAWSGDTFILVAADNFAQRQAAPFRPTPFFTVDQLIELACHPTMKLY